MNINAELKNKIKKHILKYISFICFFVVLLFPVGSTWCLTTTYPQYNLDINNVWSDTLNQAFTLGDDGVYSSNVSTSKTLSQITIRLFDDNSETDTTLNFPIMPDLYDYYIYTSYAQRTTGGTFAPNDIIITDGSGEYEYDGRLTDKQHYITRFIDSNANYGIVKQNFVAKLNLVDSSSAPNRIGGITFKGSSGTLKSVQYFELAVFLVPKGDSSAMGNIVSAINNQTNALSGKLDNIDGSIEQGNDLLENGNSDTESVVTDFNAAFEDFNQELDNLENFDDLITDEFNNANSQYMTQLQDFELGTSLLMAGNWLSNSMQTMYENSNDFKMLWLVPLLFGIPILLFVIGRSRGDD